MTNEQKKAIKEQAKAGRTVAWISNIVNKDGENVEKVICCDTETAAKLLEHSARWIYTTTMLLDDIVDLMDYLHKEGFKSPAFKRLQETAVAIAPYHKHSQDLTDMILGYE